MNDLTQYRGKWWRKEADRVVCNLCPRRCELPEGKRGFCFVRQNIGGEMILTTYGRSTGFCIDPIEKKPLNHFLPGTSVLSFGTAGCNLGCKFCQNWDISKSKEIEILSKIASPEAIVDAALKNGCRSIAFTYNDPVIWAEYAIDTAKLAREAGLKTVAVTAGYITPEARADFFSHFDAANVDLKGFTEEFYCDLTLSHLEPVLETLKWLKNESSVWFEITNLIIPGKNDLEEEIKQMCEWIVANLGRDVPVHFTAFHPDYKLSDLPNTPTQTLLRAQQIAREAGIHFSYVGNVHGSQDTWCAHCGELLIERDWYELGKFQIYNGVCPKCKSAVPGVFENSRGNWGRKRVPVQINDDAAPIQLKTKNDLPADIPRIEYTEKERAALLLFCRRILESVVTGVPNNDSLVQTLANSPTFGLFVSLKRGEFLRACRGRWGGEELFKLSDILREVTIESATSDSRFPAISEDELRHLTVEISLMHSPRTCELKGEERVKEIVIGRHGVVLIHPEGRALFLPSVASDRNWSVERFLAELSHKAELHSSAWKDDSAKLLTFESVAFRSSPLSPELDLSKISENSLQEFLYLADSLYQGREGKISLSRELATRYDGKMGLELRTSNGNRSAVFREAASAIELVKEVVSTLTRIRDTYSKDSIVELSILSQPVTIRPEEDIGRRELISSFSILGQKQDKISLLLASEKGFPDRIGHTLYALDADEKHWAAGEVNVQAFPARRAVLKERIVKTPKDIREPAVAGRFYPSDQTELEGELADYFCETGLSNSKKVRALLLPHAGWRFCGSVIAKTLSEIVVPDQVIILGPKHTVVGARWSVASHHSWRFPFGDIQIASDLRDKFLGLSSDISAEAAAHKTEHGAEVIIPFLTVKNPDARILPVALGPTTFEEAIFLGEGLGELIESDEILLIISSDMNHFASEAEGRRKDRLAIEALAAGDPERLWKICHAEKISMCGLVPAVIGLSALNRPNQIEISDYRTSAEVTGDTSSVVGYCGARIYTAPTKEFLY